MKQAYGVFLLAVGVYFILSPNPPKPKQAEPAIAATNSPK
jgi:hypothetical protein